MANKIDWFESEKKSFLKEKKKKEEDFTTEKAMKTALALPLVAGGILIGTKLLKSIGE